MKIRSCHKRPRFGGLGDRPANVNSARVWEPPTKGWGAGLACGCLPGENSQVPKGEMPSRIPGLSSVLP